MPSSRKFYKTTLTITVLSDKPPEPNFKKMLFDEESSLESSIVDIEEVVTTHPDALQMVQMLQVMGVSPRFFGLNAYGEDIDDE